MSGSFKILSWNLQGEVGIGEDRLRRQLNFLKNHTDDIDLFLFQAVNSEQGGPGTWRGHLGGLLDHLSSRGYHVVHTGDWAQELASTSVQPHGDISGSHNRCNLTASRWPLERRPLTLRNEAEGYPTRLNYYYSQFPEKILVGSIDLGGIDGSTVDVLESWNVGIINGAGWGEEKLNMLETVYARIYLRTSKSNHPVVLGGDFNAPRRETADGEIVPHGDNRAKMTSYPFYGEPYFFSSSNEAMTEYTYKHRWKRAEALLFDSDIGDWDMRDAYWIANDSRRESITDDYTHEIPSANPSRKRLDHVLVSSEFDVQSCEIWNGLGGSINGFEVSDHAPAVTEVGY